MKFDFLVEVFWDGSLVGTGQVNSVEGGSSGFKNARLSGIPLMLSSPVECCAGCTLSIRLSVRVAADSRHRSGTARLWFNDAQANSRLSATIGGLTKNYFLLDFWRLSADTGAGPKKTIDVRVDRAVAGNPFKPFGTWDIIFP